jgi:hypothetical protein
MAKNLDDLTDDEVGKMTDAEIAALEVQGESDEKAPVDQQPPAGGDGETAAPAEEGVEAKPAQPVQAVPDLEALKREIEQLRHANDGITRDLIETRNKLREVKPPEPPADPLGDLMKDVEDDDFISAGKLKEVLRQASKNLERTVEQRLEERKFQEVLARIEESRERAKTRHADYLEKIERFFSALSPTESALVQQQMLKEHDPAEAVYGMALRFEAIRGLTGNPAQAAQVRSKEPPKILGGGGRGGAPKMTAERLLTMTDAEIEKMERESPGALRELHRQMGET